MGRTGRFSVFGSAGCGLPCNSTSTLPLIYSSSEATAVAMVGSSALFGIAGGAPRAACIHIDPTGVWSRNYCTTSTAIVAAEYGAVNLDPVAYTHRAETMLRFISLLATSLKRKLHTLSARGVPTSTRAFAVLGCASLSFWHGVRACRGCSRATCGSRLEPARSDSRRGEFSDATRPAAPPTRRPIGR